MPKQNDADSIKRSRQSRNNQYLFVFSENELIEIYEGLVLRNELINRIRQIHDEIGEPENSKLLKKLGKQFSARYAANLQNGAVDRLDNYLDHEIDDEILWQRLEDEFDNE